jgi:hypothetical protein
MYSTGSQYTNPWKIYPKTKLYESKNKSLNAYSGDQTQIITHDEQNKLELF